MAKTAGCSLICILPTLILYSFICLFLLILLFFQWKLEFYISQPSLKLVEVMYAFRLHP